MSPSRALENDVLLEEEDGPDLQYYFALAITVIRKYTKWALPIAVVASIFSYDRAISAVPTFTATAVMHVAPSSVSNLTLNNYYYGIDSGFQSTQLGILASRLLMRRIVEDLQLHRRDVEPEVPAGLVSSVLATALPAPSEDAVADAPGFDASEEEQLIEQYTSMLRGAITAVPDTRAEYSNLVRVSATWHDSALAAEIANSTTRNYRSLLLEKEVEQALGNQQYLAERLTGLRADLSRAEAELQRFLADQEIDSASVEAERELSTVSGSLLEAQNERRRLEGVLEQVARAGDDLSRVPSIADHPRLVSVRNRLLEIRQRESELSRRYGPRHVRMVALASEAAAAEQTYETEMRAVVAGLRTELAIVESNEAALQDALTAANVRNQGMTVDESQLFDLQQAIEVKQELLVAFTEMYSEVEASPPVENSNVWVVDPAMSPEAANRPSATRAIVIAVLLSFMGVFGIGTLLEMLRNTVSSADELERQLDVVHMGTLPLIKHGATKSEAMGPLTEYRDHPNSYFSECIRSLRTALMLRHGGRGVSRLVVTSTDADEGKSSIALNLAFSFAQMRRTLIVDCDLRRPSLERALLPDKRHPIGLTDVLAGAAEIDACLVETDDPGLLLLPSGSRTLNPLEVLSAPGFALLLNTLGEQFDTLIFDTPPCMVVSDAYVVATQADDVVFIVKAGVSKVASARAALRRLRGLNADLVGAVLNQFDLSSSRYVPGLAGYDSYRKYSERPSVDSHPEGESAKAV